MKVTYLLAVFFSFLAVIACEPTPTGTSSEEEAGKVEVRTTTVPDNIDDPTETLPPAPDSMGNGIYQ